MPVPDQVPVPLLQDKEKVPRSVTSACSGCTVIYLSPGPRVSWKGGVSGLCVGRVSPVTYASRIDLDLNQDRFHLKLHGYLSLQDEDPAMFMSSALQAL